MDQKQPPRQFSKISVLFFQEQPFYNFPGTCPFVPRTDMNFPGGSKCSSNRYEFSRTVGGLIEKTCFFKEVSVHRTDLIFSSNRPYFLIK